MNFVTLPENADLQEVVDDPDVEKSTLTEWFTANTLSAAGHDLTYCEFPSRYTWDADHKVWNSRRRGFKLGRLRYVHPGTGETFYLRMLLMVVRGARSYEDVRTYEGTLYATFREACQARGLIGDDTEWSCLFDDVVTWATAYQLRHLFMTVLVYYDIGNVRALYDKYWRYMADDIVYHISLALGSSQAISDAALQSTLIKKLDHMFSNNGLSIASYNLLAPILPPGDSGTNRLILEELSYDRTALLKQSAEMSALLNADQRAIYDYVIQSVYTKQSFLYFVSGHGGTSKTVTEPTKL